MGHTISHPGRFLAAPEDQQSEFGDGIGARFVGLQGLLEITGNFLAGHEDQQSEFGDGFGARFVVFKAARA